MTMSDGPSTIKERLTRAERWMQWTVVLPVATHLALLILDLSDRAVYQQVGLGTNLHALSDSPLWNVAHATLVVLLVVCRRPPGIVWAHQASAGILALWGVLNFAIAWTFDQRVQLTGPVAIVLLAAAVLGLAFYWSDRETR